MQPDLLPPETKFFGKSAAQVHFHVFNRRLGINQSPFPSLCDRVLIAEIFRPANNLAFNILRCWSVSFAIVR